MTTGSDVEAKVAALQKLLAAKGHPDAKVIIAAANWYICGKWNVSISKPGLDCFAFSDRLDDAFDAVVEKVSALGADARDRGGRLTC